MQKNTISIFTNYVGKQGFTKMNLKNGEIKSVQGIASLQRKIF